MKIPRNFTAGISSVLVTSAICLIRLGSREKSLLLLQKISTPSLPSCLLINKQTFANFCCKILVTQITLSWTALSHGYVKPFFCPLNNKYQFLKVLSSLFKTFFSGHIILWASFPLRASFASAGPDGRMGVS